jgi:hypothetical protein
VRLLSEMIIFIGASLVIAAVIYGAQNVFIANDASTGVRWESPESVYSWSFTGLPLSLAEPAGPIFAPVPVTPLPGPGSEDLLQAGDAFFCAKFRDHVRLFTNRGPDRSFGFDSCSARPPKR